MESHGWKSMEIHREMQHTNSPKETKHISISVWISDLRHQKTHRMRGIHFLLLAYCAVVNAQSELDDNPQCYLDPSSLISLRGTNDTERRLQNVEETSTGDITSWPPQNKTKDDLFSMYGTIFPHGNRNAASHRWATWLLERSQEMTQDKLEWFFTGFCPVSGSPLNSTPMGWKYDHLKKVGGGTTSGWIYHCCWPCVCDSQDWLRVDTKTIASSDGDREWDVLVIGNPVSKAKAS